jgi:hypothetical protein
MTNTTVPDTVNPCVCWLAHVVFADSSVAGGDGELLPRRRKAEVEDGDGGKGRPGKIAVSDSMSKS